MLLGPNTVYKCPNCENLITNGSLMSGNTNGAKIYSDGRMFATMYPEYPEITKCRNCDAIFWLNKIEEIGTYNWGDADNQDWENADEADFLYLDDYFRALKSGLATDKDEEIYIRENIWWAYNNRIRGGKKIFETNEDELVWEKNVKKLLELLDHSEEGDQIMVAELYRNLGNYKESISILKGIDNEYQNSVKKKLLKACKQKNRWVFLLNDDEESNTIKAKFKNIYRKITSLFQ